MTTKSWILLPITGGVGISLSGLIVLLAYGLPGTASVLILEGGNLALVFAALLVLDNCKVYARVRNQGIYVSMILFVVSASLGAISYVAGNILAIFYASLGICGVGVLNIRLSIQFKPKNAT
jgi:hypothetical protein